MYNLHTGTLRIILFRFNACLRYYYDVFVESIAQKVVTGCKVQALYGQTLQIPVKRLYTVHVVYADRPARGLALLAMLV